MFFLFSNSTVSCYQIVLLRISCERSDSAGFAASTLGIRTRPAFLASWAGSVISSKRHDPGNEARKSALPLRLLPEIALLLAASLVTGCRPRNNATANQAAPPCIHRQRTSGPFRRGLRVDSRIQKVTSRSVT